MLQSDLNIKSLKESVRTAESKDEAELTAVIAAVHAYLAEEAAQNAAALAAQSSQKSLPTHGWLNAARLEAVGRRATGKLSQKLWRYGGLSALVAFCLAIGAPKSFADDATMDLNQIAVNKTSTQRFVPLQTASKHTFIKVGLLVKASRLDLEALDGAEVRDAVDGSVIATLPAQSQWALNIDSSKSIAFQGKTNVDGAVLANGAPPSRISKVAFLPNAPRIDTNKFQLPPQPGADTADGVSGYIVVPKNDKSGNQVVVVNGKLYRGALWLKPCLQDAASDSNGITAINIVDLEDYLLSVLPSEMPASWPLEALKAQAVAARSYAIANIGKHSRDGYDLRATVDDQVYLGVTQENPRSNRAVAETEGIILKHEGRPVSAFFHSTSGGSTEVAEYVWGKPVPYLRMVPDYDDMSPHFAWNRKVAVMDLQRAVCPELGSLSSFQIVSRTPSNRVKDVMATGVNGSKTISSDLLRKAFKLPSTNFNVVCKDGNFEFLGRGSGHGLGLSQWGARALAEHGYNAAQILTYYYKDVSVDYLADSTGI
ncbi:MAG TPA: SpoIID/LytB domain-containing protein [Drouetiella sp.]